MRSVVKQQRQPPTAKGAATKQRIIEAAARIAFDGGAVSMNLDVVMEASGTSKSQLYHYFPDKNALIQAVIAYETSRVFEANRQHLSRLDSFAALRLWRDAMVAANRSTGMIGGCPIGSLANELSVRSEQHRSSLVGSFEGWREIVRDGLVVMQNQGDLVGSADVEQLATALLAATQGGYLMSKTTRSSQPLEVAMDMAIAYVESHAVTKLADDN